VRRILGLAAAITGLGLAGLPGCTSEPAAPPTYKVEGNVVHKNNKAYTGGGLIEFRNARNPQNSTLGQIGEDGSFTLKTIVGNHSVLGAQDGEHTVTITPAGDGQKMHAMQLKTRYTVKAGETNTIVVKLEQ
jgi:hypothetical protein